MCEDTHACRQRRQMIALRTCLCRGGIVEESIYSSLISRRRQQLFRLGAPAAFIQTSEYRVRVDGSTRKAEIEFIGDRGPIFVEVTDIAESTARDIFCASPSETLLHVLRELRDPLLEVCRDR